MRATTSSLSSGRILPVSSSTVTSGIADSRRKIRCANRTRFTSTAVAIGRPTAIAVALLTIAVANASSPTGPLRVGTATSSVGLLAASRRVRAESESLSVAPTWYRSTDASNRRGVADIVTTWNDAGTGVSDQVRYRW